MKVIVFLKSVYGAVKAYPGNEVAAKFADLLGKKSLPAADLLKIAALGYEVEALGGYNIADVA
jgi:hypothetical protein